MRSSNFLSQRNVGYSHNIEERNVCEEDLTEEQLQEIWRDLLEFKTSLRGAADVDAHEIKIRAHQVQAALARIESLDYGYCLKCFEPVGYKLLKEAPERRFCQLCEARSR